LIDISREIVSGSPVFPGDPAIRIEPLSRISAGAACNMLRLECSNHILTHLDAPLHFFAEGPALDDLPLHRFLGPALVIQSPSAEIAESLIPPSCDGLNLLFRTGSPDAHFSRAAAERIVSSRANLAGIDSLSVDPVDSADFFVHRTLLGNGVLILEGLDLSQAEPGPYTLVALPLKIARADGAPARAVLLADYELRGG
jgi:arylformamidase